MASNQSLLGLSEVVSDPEVRAQRRAPAPLGLLGVAVAVFLGNLFTGILAAIAYAVLR
jgi:succinate-acetate transporter protein